MLKGDRVPRERAAPTGITENIQLREGEGEGKCAVLVLFVFVTILLVEINRGLGFEHAS